MNNWDQFKADKLSLMGRDCRKVLDIGQSARDDEIYFENTKYVTLDLDRNINPDIVGDICDMHMISDDSYDGIVCCAILEHVYAPWRAVQELGRITSPGGVLFGYVPFLYPYHAKEGHYSDYYRYTAEGIEYLFREEGGFRGIEICPVRGNVTTLLNLMPYVGRTQGLFAWLDGFFSNRQVSGYFFYCEK